MPSSYLLALNCGSSSIKARLYSFGAKDGPLDSVAKASASGIGAKGQPIKISVKWEEGGEDGVEKQQDEVDYPDILPLILDLLVKSDKHSIPKAALKVVTHRVVHGSTHKDPLIITNEHKEGLKEMDKLSEFAPLHNHNAVLAVRACLDALPDHTSVLLFDTMFHQTLPEEIYTYAIPPTEEQTPVPLRKYGFHGLSYSSLLSTISSHLSVQPKEVSAVVAHLGSGGSVCLISEGESKDTSMGLTPLEGLVGGTRSGSIDPTLIFHHTPDCASNALEGGEDERFISKAEMTLNKESGLKALAGTTDFGLITQRLEGSVDCSAEEKERATLAYEVYLDRLLHYVSFYLFKLLSATPNAPKPHLLFSGGIGERSSRLRADVVARLHFLGVSLDGKANGGKVDGVMRIGGGGQVEGVWVVETDEEGECAKMARKALDL